MQLEQKQILGLAASLALKADKYVPSANNNVAALTALGNLVDTGFQATDVALRTTANTFNGIQTATGFVSQSQAALVIEPFGVVSGNTGELRFLELAANGVHYIGFKAPDSLAANLVYTLPATPPTSGQVLSSTAGGVLSWVSNATAPGGANKDVQFNDGGAFGGDTEFIWDKATKQLTVNATDAPTNGSINLGTTTQAFNFIIRDANFPNLGFALMDQTKSAFVGFRNPANTTSLTSLVFYGNTHATFANTMAMRAGLASGYSLAFHTDAAERMRINTVGRVGIGTAVPAAAKLHVNYADLPISEEVLRLVGGTTQTAGVAYLSVSEISYSPGVASSCAITGHRVSLFRDTGVNADTGQSVGIELAVSSASMSGGTYIIGTTSQISCTNAVAEMTGHYDVMSYTGGSVASDFVGYKLLLDVTTFGTVNSMIGIRSDLLVGGSGGVYTTVVGGDFYAEVSAGGPDPDIIGLRTKLRVTGGVNNFYGLYLQQPVVLGTLTQEWGVYQESGSAFNYFQGFVGVGLSAPVGSEKLSVSGDTYLDGNTTVTNRADVGLASTNDGTVRFYNSTNGNYIEFLPGVTGGNHTYTFPVALPSVSGQVLSSTTGGVMSWTTVSGTGTVTSVALTLPADFSVAGSPITTSGTLAVTYATQTANTVFSGPVSGGAATPTFRALVALDIPSLDVAKITTGIFPIARGGTNSGTALNNDRIMVSSGGAIVEAAALTNGQLLIGSTGAAPVASTITAGSGISVTNGAGTITIAATGSGGTVTSVALTLPSDFSVAGSPITTSGTLAVTYTTQTANTIFSGPASGGAATPTFRALVAADIPNLDTAKITTGIFPIARGGTNSGTALNNDRIIISSGGAIVEAAALTNGQLLIGSTGAAPVAAAITAGTGISVTNGAGSITIATTGAPPTGAAGGDLSGTYPNPTVAKINGSTVPAGGALTTGNVLQVTGVSTLSYAAVNLAGGANFVTGVLPIANGGTNSSTALNNNRIMVSSGGAIVEAAALTNGQLLIGSTGAAPVAATLTAGGEITITNAAGSITIADCTTATATTTDATVTTIATIAITNNTSVVIEVFISARRTDAADRAGYIRRAVVYREAAGAATLEGTVDTTMTRESDNQWDTTISVSGNNAIITVTGRTGRTIDWKVWYRVKEVS